MTPPPLSDGFGTKPGAVPLEPESPSTVSGTEVDFPYYGQHSELGSNELADRVTAMLNAAMQRGHEWADSCRAQIRAHPMGMVGMAFVAGLLFDRLSRGRR